MDFGMLPPEVTSALIHSGPGAGSLIAASTMWHQLGAELEESVRGYVSVLSSLSDAWHGSSWAAMVTAVEPYFAWLRVTADQCQLIGSSVQTVVAAFELTHFAVAHPLQVSANRMRLAQLLATNFFGINLPAIAETEAEYQAMWVNNSAAMYRYAATSASAAVPPQFSSPPPVANPAELAAQASMVPATNAASPTASPTASTLASALATPTAFDPATGWFGLANTWANQTIAAGGYPVNILGVSAQLATAKGFQSLGGEIGPGLAEGGANLAAAEAQLASALSAAGSAQAPTAAVGVGVMVGKLTAPPGVVGLLPASQSPVQLVSAASPLPPSQSGWPIMPPLLARPTSAGSGSRKKQQKYDDIEYGSELPGMVMQRPPSAG